MFVYKSCGNYIVKLYLDKWSQTNEKRKVVDKYYAKYRCNKAYVVSIYHKSECNYAGLNILNNDTVLCIPSDSDKNFIYKVGTVVESNFNNNINSVCGSGIHYYLTEEAAFYHNNNSIIDGEVKSWNSDGQLVRRGYYVDGRYNGTYQCWYPNGKLLCLVNYNYGKINEIYVW